LSHRQAGEALFRALLSGRVRSLFDQSLGMLGDDCGLRIKLKLDPSATGLSSIDGIPWELLYRGDTDDFLGLSRRSPILRYLDVPRPVRPIPLPKPLRILAVLSSPRGLEPLDLEQEIENLGKIRGPGIQLEILRHPSMGTVRNALLQDVFHVVHYMGHGGLDPETGEGLLYFETPDGLPEAARGADLATKLKDFPSLGLVFLNACETARRAGDGQNPFAGVATALVFGGVPAVLAMQQAISDRAAIELGSTFYQRLAAGDPVDAALTEGRQAIHSSEAESMEWAIPILFLRVPDGTVFQPPPVRTWAWSRLSPRARAAVLVGMMAVPSTLLLPGVRGSLWHLVSGTTYAYPVEVAQDFTSNLPGFSGRLQTVELLPDGRMRLNFEFLNETDSDFDLEFDLGQTYLADENGNRYEVLDSGVRLHPSKDESGEGSESLHRWFDFPAPRDGAHSFSVGLVSRAEAVEFPLFEAELGSYPERYSVATLASPLPPGGERLDLPQARLASDIEGLEAQWSRVELAADGTMRWNLQVLNRSGADRTLDFRYDRIYLVDEHGNRYEVLDSSTSGRAGGSLNAYRELLQRRVRRDYWFNFPAPINGARHFQVYLGTASGGPSFSALDVEIPEYPLRLARKIEPETAPEGALRIPLDRAFDNNREGLTSTLKAIDLLPNGRMRWHVELHNQTGEEMPVGFDYPATYLADETGHRYGVIGNSTGTSNRNAVREVLPPGIRARHWLEFPAPRNGAKSFTVGWVSHDRREVSYPLFEVGPLKYDKRFGRPGERGEAPEGVDVLEIDHRFESTLSGLTGRVTEVWLLSGAQMRWWLELENRSSRDVRLGLNAGALRLIGEEGEEYRALTAGDTPELALQGPGLQRHVKARQWFELPLPTNGSRTFRVILSGRYERAPEIPSFEVTLLDHPSLARVDIRKEPAPELQAPEVGVEESLAIEGKPTLTTTPPGMEGYLAAWERLSNGRLRIAFQFHNARGEVVDLGFEPRSTYLADDRGVKYMLLASSALADGESESRPLKAGATVRHWFEFPKPADQASWFLLVLGSHGSGDFRYRPVRLDLPDDSRP